jgi:hypothetical protein
MAPSSSRFALGRVYREGIAAATARGDRAVGTDHLALALLADPASLPSRALGVPLAAAHDALDELDRRALALAGVEAPPVALIPVPRRPRRLRLTPTAREVLSGLRRTAGGERIGVQHVLLALLDRPAHDPAAELFDALGTDRDAVRRRLRELS